MKKVLWISRHQMTEEQLSDLERIMGGAVELHQWSETVNSVADLSPAIESVDAICAVLPIDKLVQILDVAGDKPVMVAKNKRDRDANTGEFVFTHDGWYQTLKVEVVQRRL